MSGDFVPVASYNDPLEAELARNRLEAEGIRAFLMERETTAMAWQLAQAIGGVKLLVAPADEDRAAEILDRIARRLDPRTVTPDAAESEAIVAKDDVDKIEPLHEEDVDDDDPPTDRELNAERAFKAQIFTFLCFPLQLVALFLIFSVAGSNERLEGKPLRRFRTALVLHFVCWLMFGIFLLFNAALRR